MCVEVPPIALLAAMRGGLFVALCASAVVAAAEGRVSRQVADDVGSASGSGSSAPIVAAAIDSNTCDVEPGPLKPGRCDGIFLPYVAPVRAPLP